MEKMCKNVQDNYFEIEVVTNQVFFIFQLFCLSENKEFNEVDIHEATIRFGWKAPTFKDFLILLFLMRIIREQKLIEGIKVKKDKNDNDKIVIKNISGFLKFVGKTARKENYDSLIESCEKYLNCSVKIEKSHEYFFKKGQFEEKDGLIMFNIIDNVKYNRKAPRKDRKLVIVFNKYFLSLVKTPELYRILDINILKKFSRPTFVKIFLYFFKYNSGGNWFKTKFSIRLKDFCKRITLSKNNPYNLKEKLEGALEEISFFTNMQVSVDYQDEGQKDNPRIYFNVRTRGLKPNGPKSTVKLKKDIISKVVAKI